MRNVLFGVALLLGAMAVAACGGGGTPATTPATQATSSGSTATITIGLPCPSAPPRISQAFPSSGATGIATTAGSVIFIYATADVPLSNWGILKLNGVSEGPLGTPPSPLPSPLPTLSAGQAYLSANIITPLAASTTYSASATFTDGCGQADAQSTGTFTTQ